MIKVSEPLASNKPDASTCPHVDAVTHLLEEAAQYALPMARQTDTQAAA